MCQIIVYYYYFYYYYGLKCKTSIVKKVLIATFHFSYNLCQINNGTEYTFLFYGAIDTCNRCQEDDGVRQLHILQSHVAFLIPQQHPILVYLAQCFEVNLCPDHTH